MNEDTRDHAIELLLAWMAMVGDKASQDAARKVMAKITRERDRPEQTR